MTHPLVALTAAQCHHKDSAEIDQESSEIPLKSAPSAANYKAEPGCQFIAGEPSVDDSCKCGRPTDGSSYCALHRLFCTMPATAWNLKAALASASRATEPRDEDGDGDLFGHWPIGDRHWTDPYGWPD